MNKLQIELRRRSMRNLIIGFIYVTVTVLSIVLSKPDSTYAYSTANECYINFYSSFEEAAIKAKNNYGNINDPTQKLIKSGFKTYDEAQSHLNQKISILEKMQDAVLVKINTLVEAQLKKKELEEEIIKNNLGSISNINSEISRIEQNKQDALDLLSNLTKLEVELPQEELVFNEGRIRVHSVEREINELEDSIKKDEDK